MKKINKKTKIVATIGPASDAPETIKQLYEYGVDVFRLNFSHGTHESHGKVIDTIRSLNLKNAAILLDTKGPEIRVGEIRDKVHVKEGDKFTMTVEKGVYEDTGKISVNYEGFVKDVNVGDIIVIDSGIVQAKALSKTDKDIEFQVIEGEVDMTTKRHINLHGRPVDLPTVTEQDWKDIDFGIERKVDFIALSFVRTGDDVVRVRDHCRSKGVNIQIISKVENYESTENLEDIIRKSDGLMVARGDLSCEISFGQVPTIQKKMVALCSYYNKPVIIATQMVLSMVNNIQPTRAEVSDVGNAIFEGADAIMTSDETTKSIHPVLVIKTMAKIAKETEDSIYNLCEWSDCDSCFGILHQGRLQRKGFESKIRSKPQGEIEANQQQSKMNHHGDGMCMCGHESMVTENIISILPFVTRDCQAIVGIHNSDDNYMKNISASRIARPMFGFTNNEMLANQMSLIWNMQPELNKDISDDYDKNVKIVDAFLKEKGVTKYIIVADMKDGDKIYPTVQVRKI